MSFDPTGHLLLTPEDTDAPNRMVRLRELGLGDAPVPEFDDFARNLARITGAPYAMVNFIGEHKQYFAGLYSPGADQAVELDPTVSAGQSVGRVMARDHGYCPHVIVRRKALVLEDVCDYPRFAGNPVVDEIGIRSYLGAPLIDRTTGMALGTVCVVDQEPRPWGRQGLETIKTMASDLVDQIHQREQRR
jgi:GAF domain-containing protein